MNRLVAIALAALLLPACGNDAGKNEAAIKHNGDKSATLIIAAVRSGDITACADLIERGADVQCRDENGSTLLHIACGRTDSRILEALIAAGADLDAQDGDGNTPLHCSVSSLNVIAVQGLLQAGADPNLTNHSGDTPLDIALEKGQPDISVILAYGGSGTAKFLPSSIPEAAMTCDVGTVRRMLAEGRDVNERDRFDRTALLYAAQGGNVELVELLLSHGARTAEMYNSKGPLHYSAAYGHIDVVRVLLDAGANPNSVSIRPGSVTPLCKAIQYVQMETARMLIDRGADVNKSVLKGTPLLVIAAREDGLMFIRLLVENGADIDASDIDGNSALHVAVRCGDRSSTEYLLERGANPSPQNREGKTPLDFAESEEIKKLIIEHGAKAGEELPGDE
jgi:ankyrin repeat protein